MLCCAQMGLDVTTEEFSAHTVATQHNHATESMVQLNKYVLVDVLRRSSLFVVLCTASAAQILMQPDNLCYAKAWPPNYQATDKNM